MERNFGWFLAACLIPGPVFALGLGKLVLDSGLNEPLEARIELLSPTREELDSLAVALADSEAFERAGVERQFILSGLKFELSEGEVGPDFIRVYSRDAIREPFLNFLVEINWSKGRLVREYTVLLDPPLYEPGMRAPVATAAAPASSVSESVEAESGGSAAETEMPAAVVSYTGGDYGPTQQNDTLWSIASRMRPNDSVSVQQMMLALYRTNPEAFINNNINGLRRGQILRVPPESELSTLTREQAFAEAQSQNSAWDPGLVAQAATPAPQVAPAAPEQPSATPAPAAAAAAPSPSPAPAPAKEAELRLVAPGKAGTGAGGESGAADRNLDLANEQLSALTQENIDLKARVADAETIIEDLKLLIALKDEELAALQKNMADASARKEAAAAAEPVEPAAVPETKPAPAAPPEPAPEATAKPPESTVAGPASKAEVAPAPAEPVPAKEAPAASSAKPKPATAPASKPPETALGVFVDPIITWLKGNLMILGAALGAIIVVIGGLVFVSRRKHASAVAAEDEAASAAVQFPDFAGSEEETILPGGAAEVAAAPEVEKRGAPARPEVKPAVAAAKPAPAPAAPAPAPAPEVPQEDPLAEVNVFLAYEHFDQAEQFVREAISREPDNLDFHSKLLEVFYAANDRRKYEQAARVLHDKVGGSGPHWDMALVMWKEISPARALFSEPAADEDQAPAPAAGVGMLDLTTKEKAASADDGLDFDLGELTAQPAAPAAASEAASDVLDVTASVGLGTDEELLSAASGESEGVLDLTGGQGGDEEALPDPAAAQTGDDLLDVTSHSNLEDAGLDADPLDVTVAAPSSVTDEAFAASSAPSADAGNSMDFDLSLGAEEPAADNNVIEFESGLGKSEAEVEAGGLELDLSAGLEASAGEEAGMDLDIGSGKDDDLGLSLDMPGGDEAGAGELSLEVPGSEAGGLDLSFDAADTGGSGELSLEDLAEEGSDQTVFVPRTDGTQAQSAEDEIATKLDLAKAYVELGDKSSARGILDEIASAGNEEQRRQAEELRQQAS